MSLESGDYIGGCRIVEKLGEGGMGAVYRAHQQALGRTVALKILQGAGSADELESRFERETKIHIQLSHPHLVKVYDAGRERELRYLVLELVEGSTLRPVIRAPDRPSWETAASMFSQILEALAYLEGAGIVHRDLKPENILVDREGLLKVADFGLVKADTATLLTNPGQVVGTLKYLAPEVLRGELITPKADMYAASLIFYELLTGRLPYEGTDTTTWLQAILHAVPRPLRDFRQDLSAAHEACLERLLDKDAGRRPRAAAALPWRSGRRSTNTTGGSMTESRRMSGLPWPCTMVGGWEFRGILPVRGST